MASKNLKNVELKQFVLVLDTNDNIAYPPSGLRVALADTWEELIDEIEYFFQECTDIEVPDLSTEESVVSFLDGLDDMDDNPIRGWSIYSEDGYIH